MQVLADDTDICVLYMFKPLAYILMRKYNGNLIGLTATAAKLGNKCSGLLPVRAQSEYHTVSHPYVKWMVSAVTLMLL